MQLTQPPPFLNMVDALVLLRASEEGGKATRDFIVLQTISFFNLHRCLQFCFKPRQSDSTVDGKVKKTVNPLPLSQRSSKASCRFVDCCCPAAPMGAGQHILYASLVCSQNRLSNDTSLNHAVLLKLFQEFSFVNVATKRAIKGAKTAQLYTVTGRPMAAIGDAYVYVADDKQYRVEVVDRHVVTADGRWAVPVDAHADALLACQQLYALA